jgi:hypothetical protein
MVNAATVECGIENTITRNITAGTALPLACDIIE